MVILAGTLPVPVLANFAREFSQITPLPPCTFPIKDIESWSSAPETPIDGFTILQASVHVTDHLLVHPLETARPLTRSWFSLLSSVLKATADSTEEEDVYLRQMASTEAFWTGAILLTRFGEADREVALDFMRTSVDIRNSTLIAASLHYFTSRCRPNPARDLALVDVLANFGDAKVGFTLKTILFRYFRNKRLARHVLALENGHWIKVLYSMWRKTHSIEGLTMEKLFRLSSNAEGMAQCG